MLTEEKTKIGDKVLEVLNKAEPRPNALECIEILRVLERAFKLNILKKIKTSLKEKYGN